MKYNVKSLLLTVAWVALLVFVMLKCSITFDWQWTPSGPNGEPPGRYLHFQFRVDNAPVIDLGDGFCCPNAAPV